MAEKNLGSKKCPNCHMLDSLEVDEIMGEVVCTNCAIVTAMGLPESEQTRFISDATFSNVDHRYDSGRGTSDIPTALQRNVGNRSLNVTTLREMKSESSSNNSFLDAERIRIPPQALQLLQRLVKQVKLSDHINSSAVALLKTFIANRRRKGLKLEGLQEVTVICLQIAAAQSHQPLPTFELRHFFPSLKSVDLRRIDVIRELKMEQEEEELQKRYMEDLVSRYLMQMKLRLFGYEKSAHILCKILETAIPGESEKWSITDRIILAILLLSLSDQLQWPEKLSTNSSCTTTIHRLSSPYSSYHSNKTIGEGGLKKGKELEEATISRISTLTHASENRIKHIYALGVGHIKSIAAAFHSAIKTASVKDGNLMNKEGERNPVTTSSGEGNIQDSLNFAPIAHKENTIRDDLTSFKRSRIDTG